MDTAEITTTMETLHIHYDPTLLISDRKDNYQKHDNFFEQFTKIWLPLIIQGRYKDAEKIWDKALEIASAHEAKHKNSIHKGTAYYFWGGTCILSGDLDTGFHLMHQALDEDKKLGEVTGGVVDFKKTPAYAFVKMDDVMAGQFFRDAVKQVAIFVNGALLNRYRTRSILRNIVNNEQIERKLDINSLRSKVLENNSLGDVPFFLVYNFFRFKKLLDAKKEIRQNDFASLIQAQTILGFCIVAEELLKKTYQKKTWPVYLGTFASNNNLPNLTQDEAGKITGKFNTDFKGTLAALLASTYTYENGGRKPSPIEEDLLMLYGIRNTSAHNLNSEQVIYENFEEISQKVLNALFFIVERVFSN